ncbi:peptidase [Vibrio vulnificus]|uniref:peptidase n=1 Tax=Vibrio vulnificus TaxID=672 RepID=UPI0006AD284E|nr:peptidase [Vibrio vulnificus]KOR99830.1 peptidase [Vibrio vulnificus]HDY8066863.1 peptidase [Vibrio vulnificus]
MKTRLLSLMLPMVVCSIAYANNPELDFTEVTIANDVIYYKGVLSPEGNDLAFELYENAKEKPTTLVITSDGGDIMLGIELGEWIYNNKMSVEVNDYCLSSCANYVFPSGKIKYISNRAIIGFHGGATSKMFDMSEIDDMLFSLPKKEREEEKRRLLSDMQRYLKTAKAKEKEYFQKIKVNQTITTLGQDEKYSIYDTNRYSGWTYVPDDYTKLGVHNVIVKSPPWKLVQTDNKGFGKVFIVKVE